jgi:hypothetical protein
VKTRSVTRGPHRFHAIARAAPSRIRFSTVKAGRTGRAKAEGDGHEGRRGQRVEPEMVEVLPAVRARQLGGEERVALDAGRDERFDPREVTRRHGGGMALGQPPGHRHVLVPVAHDPGGRLEHERRRKGREQGHEPQLVAAGRSGHAKGLGHQEQRQPLRGGPKRARHRHVDRSQGETEPREPSGHGRARQEQDRAGREEAAQGGPWGTR